MPAAIDLLHPLHRTEFLGGLSAGALALVLGVVIGALWLWRAKVPVPIGGYLVAAAAIIALVHSSRTTHASASLVTGVVLLGAGGLIGDLLRLPVATRAALAVPGAWFIAAQAGLPDIAWVRWVVPAWIVLGGLAAASFDETARRLGAGPVLVAITVVGIYYVVPDTEQALALLGATLPVMFLGWPLPLASLGKGAVYPLLGVLAWTSAVGGVGRPSAIVGALACLGLLGIAPLAQALTRGRTSLLDPARDRRWTLYPLAAFHLFIVFLASRLVGVRATTGQAAYLAVAVLGMALVALVAMAFARGRLGQPALVGTSSLSDATHPMPVHTSNTE